MKKILLLTFCFFAITNVFAQKAAKNPAVYVDNKGIMRWSDTKKEASFYGINYTAPFAQAYYSLKTIGVDPKQTIDKDTYHFSRLGFDAYRIHIWDIEISDKQGNLVNSPHLDLFDYLLFKLKERGIYIILTPMCHYTSMNTSEGFIEGITKCTAHMDKDVIAKQANYIYNLAKHVNPYTGLSYGDDPNIIGYEIDNEPCHPGTADDLKYYINTMLGAFKKAGNKKPVFYNVTHNLHLVDTYFQTGIQGATFQWYPTGLTAGHARKGNFLPNADEYQITFKDVRNYNKMAKMVYEYDIPDVLETYMYPAVTRSFRSQGMQWISMFAYDPIDIAFANIEYYTHYMNLAYTPGKALSQKIAAEVMRVMPLSKQYEQYPKDTIFESFRLSYLEDLSEMNTPEKFFYTNNTSTQPVQLSALSEIAGRGSSPVVKYEGEGAYFLDKIDDGVWRLEVMPDVLWIKDPAERPSIKKEVATIMWNTWPMEISLPSLGTNYTFAGLNSGNNARGTASGSTMNVSPGVYLLTKAGQTPSNQLNADTKWGMIRLGEYAAPAPRANVYHVIHTPSNIVTGNNPVSIKADIAGPATPDSVALYLYPSRNARFTMKHAKGLTYEATIPANFVTGEKLRYMIVAYRNGKPQTFPANVDVAPTDRDFYWTQCWESPVVNQNSVINLVTIDNRLNEDIEILPIPYDADRKNTGATKSTANTSPDEGSRMKISLDVKGKDIRYFLRRYIKPDIDPRRDKLAQVSNICIVVKNQQGLDKLNIGFVTNMGYTYTTTANLTSGGAIYKIPISAVSQVATALLPETYPIFMKRYFVPDVNIPFRIQDIELLEISTNGLTDNIASFELGAVWLE